MDTRQSNTRQERGTVLILCVALLVILGMLASGFVIIAHANKGSSRALNRADRFEQVRQMSLAYVQALLLEDLVGDDGIFLNNDNNDEAYDAPATAADPWLNHHGTTGGNADTDGDGTNDANWGMAGIAILPRNVFAPDGTQYRVAIRIVDTNGLANINVGMADPSGVVLSPAQWDGKYPYYLNLVGSELLHSDDAAVAEDLDNNAAGRIPNYGSYASDLHEALFEQLYTYLAYPNPGNTRPFDLAEELALRMQAGSGTDLHGRLGTLWPATFGANSDLLTAYSWTMQIRPAFTQEIEDELIALGYPGPCKIPLSCLFNPDGSVNEDGCKAIYLALYAAGMNTNDEAAQFLVNLIDYIDDDNDNIEIIGPVGTANSIIDFAPAAWPAAPAAPSKAYYGTDSQPIISEVYSYRDYDEDSTTIPGTYIYNRNGNCRYAVELYNPSGADIDLTGWKIDIGGNEYEINDFVFSGDRIIVGVGSDDNREDYFLTLVSNGDLNPPGKTGVKADLAIDPVPVGGANITIKLIHPSGIVVDRFLDCDFKEDPPNSPAALAPLPVTMEDFQRQGNDVDGNLIPAIVHYKEYESSSQVVLDDFSAEAISPAGDGGQIILRDGELHSLGELFYIPKVANDGTDAKLIEKMEDQPGGDSTYRWGLGDPFAFDIVRRMLQNFALRTGLNDGFDNDGDNHIDVQFDAGSLLIPSSINEARVPGVININTAPAEVINALHYYFDPAELDVGNEIDSWRASSGMEMVRFASRVKNLTRDQDKSKDEDPDGTGVVGSPDGITVDNEEALFHFTNVANLIGVRSDVFVVYITIQASDRDGDFASPGATMRTMAIVDRSYCLKPAGTPLANIPLPRIVAQTRLP